jgi:hypothetical protein
MLSNYLNNLVEWKMVNGEDEVRLCNDYVMIKGNDYVLINGDD